jgi:hypothetical protein
VTALLVFAVLLTLARLPIVGASLLSPLILHLGFLVAFVLTCAALGRWERASAVRFIRPAVVVALLFTLYTTLGQLGVALWPEWSQPPYRADAALSAIDVWMLGFDPSLWLQSYQRPGWVEFYSFVYAAFIPYINLSLALNSLGRPPVERDQFLTGWVFTYSISFVGYLLVPAHGPVVYHAADYDVALEGGLFYDTVLSGMQITGGLQGVFPSLHVGGSVYLCLFDLQKNRLRGLTYLPLVLLIYVSTLFMRYHYVIDLLAGTVVAACCLPLGQKAFLHWARRREAAGLPALPGGEGDALSTIPGAGLPDAADLFPPD